MSRGLDKFLKYFDLHSSLRENLNIKIHYPAAYLQLCLVVTCSIRFLRN